MITQIAATVVLGSFLAMIAASFFLDNDDEDRIFKYKMKPVDYLVIGFAGVLFLSIFVTFVGLIWGI
jgi:hypothetical protein